MATAIDVHLGEEKIEVALCHDFSEGEMPPSPQFWRLYLLSPGMIFRGQNLQSHFPELRKKDW
jgi:hypothetical protein